MAGVLVSAPPPYQSQAPRSHGKACKRPADPGDIADYNNDLSQPLLHDHSRDDFPRIEATLGEAPMSENEDQFAEGEMRLSGATLVMGIMLCSLVALAQQGPCTEEFIRAEEVKETPLPKTS